MIHKLMFFLNKKQRRGVMVMTVLIVIGAALETLGVSAIIPIVQLFMEDEAAVSEKFYVRWIMDLFHIEGISHIFVLTTGFMILIYIIKNLYLLFLTYVQNRFVNTNKAQTQGRMLAWYLNRPYEYFLDADISVIHRSIRSDIDNVFAILLACMQILTELVVAGSICLFLLVTDWKMTLYLVALLGAVTLIIAKGLKNSVGQMGRKNQDYIGDLTKWELQSMYGIKVVKVMRKEKYFDDGHKATLAEQSGLLTRYAVFNTIPKLFLETVCIGGILGYLIVSVLAGADMTGMVTSLSAFAIAAFRVLPSASRINTYLSNLSYYQPSLDYIYDLIRSEGVKEADMMLPDEFGEPAQPISLKDKIVLKNVTFLYPDTDKKILDHAQMEIPFGATVGIKGPSGSGKTTLVDVLLGLLTLQEGQILCDGVDVLANKASWLAQIGYISQTVYMLDDTIRANVAFGVPADKIREERVREVLAEAQLLEFVQQLPGGLDTEIGEQGVRLSGGQRQRIGIARALYHNPELLVFDEATSALDQDTESAIMAAIDSFKGKKTMIIIAHRLRTIENCDRIYEVKDGKIYRER